ncbi:helix-turn-helix domain-containing protein [Amycolatopsis sp. H20-H5]|uniref:helix-turn-helix domain-containing protein n=1 Tax=Amycolatopsis sp. H20-H5 TaxID=3046309 RepID=UPI002DB760EF|nr:helix-turn-helix domain-containing protein [Amycolatopsis sp. H20-H5]MEC3975765.1 helix-turn-helix domain-containing protein [Amycolatopsis sp. H20-H5]
MELFAARSYDDVTVAEVCARAVVAKRYFYDHFADRADLLITGPKASTSCCGR